jgi:hypothetical protein
MAEEGGERAEEAPAGLTDSGVFFCFLDERLPYGMPNCCCCENLGARHTPRNPIPSAPLHDDDDDHHIPGMSKP